ncbi:MAG: hypothetical protein ACYTJ0_09645 [Planctomycetota bacterium]|jgi:hypothetical protein
MTTTLSQTPPRTAARPRSAARHRTGRAGPASASAGIRLDLVRQIRAEIEAGVFETDARIERATERLARTLGLGR